MLGPGLKLLKVYLNDVDVTSVTQSTFGSFIANLTGGSFFVGGDGFQDDLVGDMSDFWFAPEVSLLDGNGEISTSTRRMFIDSNGKPANPSGFPAGGAILFAGDASSYSNNQLGGGTFYVSATPLSGIALAGAGSVSLPGATIGQVVVHIHDDTADRDATADFETTISINNQIQQTGTSVVSSGDTLHVYVSNGTLTNADTSPSN